MVGDVKQALQRLRTDSNSEHRSADLGGSFAGSASEMWHEPDVVQSRHSEDSVHIAENDASNSVVKATGSPPGESNGVAAKQPTPAVLPARPSDEHIDADDGVDFFGGRFTGKRSGAQQIAVLALSCGLAVAIACCLCWSLTACALAGVLSATSKASPAIKGDVRRTLRLGDPRSEM